MVEPLFVPYEFTTEQAPCAKPPFCDAMGAKPIIMTTRATRAKGVGPHLCVHPRACVQNIVFHDDLQGCQEEQGCCSSRVVAPLSGAVFETCLVALDIVCLKQIARTRYTIVILQHVCDSQRRSRRATLRLVAHARCTARSLHLT